ncbi:hypothetical protein OUZ56_003107 [Daphnia magna]|uniref:Uncharacterized protein n=1 Tax=Daphnia magna TaxID=35525 RepID=A0ABR0A821_9CRUS|nr:hypothetical protein OUZ56_003107 [Daphnia magna]
MPLVESEIVCGFFENENLELDSLRPWCGPTKSLVVICDHWSFRATPKQEKKIDTAASSLHSTKKHEVTVANVSRQAKPFVRLVVPFGEQEKEGGQTEKGRTRSRSLRPGHGVLGIPDLRPFYAEHSPYFLRVVYDMS